MSEGFEVGHSNRGEELTEEQRHEMVAAQLRGEASAAGKAPDSVVAAVGQELREVGLEPDEAELQRRYEEIDPDIAVVQDVPQGEAADLPADAPGAPGADAGGTPVSDGSVTAVLDPSTDPGRQAAVERGTDRDRRSDT